MAKVLRREMSNLFEIVMQQHRGKFQPFRLVNIEERLLVLFITAIVQLEIINTVQHVFQKLYVAASLLHEQHTAVDCAVGVGSSSRKCSSCCHERNVIPRMGTHFNSLRRS